MQNFEEKINRTIAEHHMFADGDKVLVALSGGADSVVLLRLLLARGIRCEAVHCNFRLRAEESDRDEHFVRRYCREMKVRLHVRTFDTRTYAQTHGISIEMAARDLRYAYFKELKEQLRFDKIAVGHHRDDNVETLLLNILRGTGLRGLGGIQYINGDIVRPLLDVSRQEIEAYLQGLQQAYVTDSSNMESDVTRNKIRLQLLPLLTEIQPAAVETIQQEICHFRGAYNLYKMAVDACIAKVFDGERIHIDVLTTLPSPETVLYEILSGYGFHASQIHDIYQRINGVSGRLYESERWRLLRDRNCLILQNKEERYECLTSYLPLQGEVKITRDVHFVISRTVVDNRFQVSRRKEAVCLDIDKLSYPLTVRLVREGDRFMPFGMKGMKLVSDFLTDMKKSLFDKERQLVLCSGDDIAWVVGERIDQRFCVDNGTGNVLMIEMIKM